MEFLDIVALVGIFVVMAGIGFMASNKVASSDDYILASKNLNKVQAGFSMAASDFGGSAVVGACAYIYLVGIAGSLWNLAAAPALFLLGFLIAKKLWSLNISTVPEFFGARYNNKLRTFTSILHLVGISTMIGGQFIVASCALSVLLGIPEDLSTIISLAFVLMYTVGGGFLAVVNTDIFQYVIIVISLLIIIPLSLTEIGGLSGMVASLPPEFLDFGAIGFSTPLSWMLLCLFTYGTNQVYLQRVFASKDTKTASFSFYFAGASYIFFGLVIGIIGLAIVVLYPGLDDPNIGYTLLIKDMIPTGLAGIAIGGLFAATLSTSDSMLIGASSLFVNDIYKPLIKKEKTDAELLKISRIVTVIIALVSVLISRLFQSLVDVMYVSGLLYSAVVFFPLIIGLLDKRITSNAATISIVSAFIVGIVSEVYLSHHFTGILGLPSNILCSVTGLIILYLVTFLERKKSKGCNGRNVNETSENNYKEKKAEGL